MNDIRERLIACFSAVFPMLETGQVVNATIDTVSSWDSAHHFMLMQVIEETFGVELPESVLGEIHSFDGFEHYLTTLQRPA
jgi:acyl carrier protein